MASQTSQKDPETMEETTSSLIYRACELARNLESNLPNLAKHPDMLSLSIDEIVKAFVAAKERLMFSHHRTPPSSSFAHTQTVQQPDQMCASATSNSMQEWLNLASSSGYAQSLSEQLIQMQQLQAASSDMRASLEGDQIGDQLGGTDVEGSNGSEAMEASSSRQRRRKNDLETKTLMVPAPQFGNTEVPPDDGFTWRKYGQKEIYGSKYPRSYYRCTHQKLYQCPAKRQVQRLDHHPNIFAVTYRGSHTCIMSSTAPSSVPPPQLLVDHIISPQLSSSSISVSQWLSSAHLSLGGGAANLAPAAVDAGTAGPSTSRYGNGSDYLVADMADAMFNSGSSSGNSTMESLFPFTEDKCGGN